MGKKKKRIMPKSKPAVIIIIQTCIQTWNNYSDWRKRNQRKAHIIEGLTIISPILIIISTSCDLISKWKERITPEKIYLNLWETNKKIPLKVDGITVPPINEIKNNEPTVLRFALTQENRNPPQITKIFVTFPQDILEADISPIVAEGWNWKRNNDSEITYYLDFKDIPAKGPLYNLPAFKVKIQKRKLLLFKYKIIGNKIDLIERSFTINPELKYQDLLNGSYSDGVFDNSIESTVSPSVVVPQPAK